MVASNLSILIVDDEPLARNRMRALCGRVGDIGDVALAGGGNEAIQSITETRPDVILLDVDMPDLSGMDVAEYCQKLGQAPEIIFTTAHSKYAVDAFRLEATDYLLKPVKEARLKEALDRARTALQNGQKAARSTGPQRLWVHDGKSALQIAVADIERIEAERDYMRICLPGRSYLVHKSMRELAAMLPADMFPRIHRSTIVRRDLIRELRRSGRKHYVVLTDGGEQSVGPSYVEKLSKF